MNRRPAVKPLEYVPQVYRDRPIYYITNRFSVAGPGADVLWPDYSHLMDFELELGIFLSRGGRNIKASDAASHIFGYTIYNDVSARDLELAERGLAQVSAVAGDRPVPAGAICRDLLQAYRKATSVHP